MSCAFEYFVAILVSGSFLTKVLVAVGLSDAMIGIISSFISLAFLFQLLSIPLSQCVTNTKRCVAGFRIASHLFFLTLYVLPFWSIPNEYKQVVAVFCVLFAYFCLYLVSLLCAKWSDSFIDPTHRARFGASKEMVSLLGGMIVSLLVGYVLDAYEADGNLSGGFLFTAIAGLVFALCDFSCLLIMKNRINTQRKKEKLPTRDIVKNTLGNTAFLNILIMSVLRSVGVYFASGFLSVYYLKELAFSVLFVEVITMLGSLARCAISKPFGRYSDKKSFAKGMELGVWLEVIAYGILMFATPQLRYFIIPASLLRSVAMAGINSNAQNMMYSYIDKKYFVQASAIKNSVSGVCGFLASLAGGALLAHIQANGNTLFGIPVYGQQVLCGITFVLLLGTTLFLHLVIGKQKVQIQ